MCAMNRPANNIPIGFDTPSNATDIPLKPSGAITSSTCIYLPVEPRYISAPPIPASTPDIDIASMIFFLSFIPAYLLASLFIPQAFNSKPKVVFSIIIYIITTAIITIKSAISKFASGNSISRPSLGVFADSATGSV